MDTRQGQAGPTERAIWWEPQFVEAGMGEPAENLEVARRYLQAIERGATGAELRSFFTSDVVLEEFPNRVVPLGKRRGLAEALEGAQRAKKIMSRQIYKITRGMADQDRLAPQVEWVGTLAVAFGTIPARGQMKAFLAVFLDSATGRSSRSGTTIVSRPGDARDGGKYQGTVRERTFVVPFSHCLGNGK